MPTLQALVYTIILLLQGTSIEQMYRAQRDGRDPYDYFTVALAGFLLLCITLYIDSGEHKKGGA